MTFDELYRKILEILPRATMGEEDDDNLVIYTYKKIVRRPLDKEIEAPEVLVDLSEKDDEL